MNKLTLSKVAEQAGTSKATVHRFLKEDPPLFPTEKQGNKLLADASAVDLVRRRLAENKAAKSSPKQSVKRSGTKTKGEISSKLNDVKDKLNEALKEKDIEHQKRIAAENERDIYKDLSETKASENAELLKTVNANNRLLEDMRSAESKSQSEMLETIRSLREGQGGDSDTKHQIAALQKQIEEMQAETLEPANDDNSGDNTAIKIAGGVVLGGLVLMAIGFFAFPYAVNMSNQLNASQIANSEGREGINPAALLEPAAGQENASTNEFGANTLPE